jgi:hypothetical protein
VGRIHNHESGANFLYDTLESSAEKCNLRGEIIDSPTCTFYFHSENLTLKG